MENPASYPTPSTTPYIPIKPKPNTPKILFVLIALLAIIIIVGTVGFIFIKQPDYLFQLKKIVNIFTPAKKPLPPEIFSRPENQKATFYSNYLQKDITINNAPEFMAIPASLSIYGDLVSAVVVEVIDDSHFIVETKGATIPIVVNTSAGFAKLQLKPNAKPDSQKNFTVIVQEPPQNLNGKVEKLDLLTFNLEKIASQSTTITKWQEDQDGYTITHNILIYAKE